MSPVRAKRPWRGGVVLGVAAAGGALAVALTHRGWTDGVAVALSDAHWGWVAAAIAAQTLSIGALARQQRRLLTVSGNRLPLPAMVATTSVGGSISLSFPIIGKAAAAAYSYRRFTARGVRPEIVGWALAMSALHLTLAYFTIGAAGALVTGSPDGIVAGLASIAVVIAPAVALVAAVRRTNVRRAVDGAIDRIIDRIIDLVGRSRTRRWLGIRDGLHHAVHAVASVRPGVRSTIAVAGWSLVNLTATLSCLVLSILAVGGGVPWSSIILVWAAAAGVAQLGLTPGGIGVVDAALTLGLVAAGMPTGTAVAATLVYRTISLYFAVAAGGVTFLIAGRSARGTQRAPRVREVPSAEA